jgi:hypothetical protein
VKPTTLSNLIYHNLNADVEEVVEALAIALEVAEGLYHIFFGIPR